MKWNSRVPDAPGARSRRDWLTDEPSTVTAHRPDEFAILRHSAKERARRRGYRNERRDLAGRNAESPPACHPHRESRSRVGRGGVRERDGDCDVTAIVGSALRNAGRDAHREEGVHLGARAVVEVDRIGLFAGLELARTRAGQRRSVYRRLLIGVRGPERDATLGDGCRHVLDEGCPVDVGLERAGEDRSEHLLEELVLRAGWRGRRRDRRGAAGRDCPMSAGPIRRRRPVR